MEKYLVLVSMKQPNKITGNKIVSNLQKITTETVSHIWFDSAYFGVPLVTDKIACEIWDAAMVDLNTSDIRDMLIVELGRDWLAYRDTRADHWLSTHLGKPLQK